MTTIHKYQLEVTNRQSVVMPAQSDILCVQIQNGIPCLWARVNPEFENHTRTILIFGTGHEITGDTGRYIGTFQMENQTLVFHVFEG